MSRPHRPRVLGVVARWLWGTALVTWRYVWETTPLHRSDGKGDESDLPPEMPPDAVDAQVQLVSDGYGPMFHRVFRVRVAAANLDAGQLIDRIVHDFKHFVPSEVVGIRTADLGDRGLSVGDEMLVEMPGPWNGPVRVVYRDDTSLSLVTLRGHLESGQVQFRTRDDGAEVIFEIELWARASSRLVHLLYSRLRLAKEIQLNMWARFCLAAVTTCGGRLVGGVYIVTRWLDPSSDAFVAVEPSKRLPRLLLRTAALGLATGARSTLGVTAMLFSQRPGQPKRPARGRARLAAGALAVGTELVADKLPMTPSRLQAPSLAVRIASGTGAGVALARQVDAPVAVPALIGGACAAAGSFAGAAWRESAATHMPAWCAALVEDAAALSLASAAVRQPVAASVASTSLPGGDAEGLIRTAPPAFRDAYSIG